MAIVTAAPAADLPVAGSKHRTITYSVGIKGLLLASAPTDFFMLWLQNYNRRATLRSVTVTGVSDTAGEVDILLQKAASGGGGTFTQPTVAAHDGYAQAPIATAYAYTANRTGGDGVSANRPILRAGRLKFATSSGGSEPVRWTFADRGSDSAPPVLRHLNEALVLNLAGQTMPGTGAKVNVDMEIEEARLVRVAMIGDSTTAVANPGYINGSWSNGGGIGTSGLMQAEATIENMGSNGYRLYDFLMNTNSVSWPLYVTQNRLYDIAVCTWLINDFRTGLTSLNSGVAMLDTMIYWMLNGASANDVYVSPKATSFAIQSMTWSGGTVTVTTVADHGFWAGSNTNVQIAGATPAGYNGYYPITVTGTRTFTFALAGDPGAMTVAGTATYAMKTPQAITATPGLKIILYSPNGVCADDDANRYLSAAGNTVLSGQWTGMTQAQAATALNTMLYQAYVPFENDKRVFAVRHKQDLQITSPVDGITRVYALPTWREARDIANVPLTGTKLKTMADRIHPGAEGQLQTQRQIQPVIQGAIRLTYDTFIY